MIDLSILRARIAELESRNMSYAPASVRARWDFDLKALKMLLALLENKGEN
jgi:hypothetical protein